MADIELTRRATAVVRLNETGTGTVHVDGEDISHYVSEVAIHAEPRAGTAVTVSMACVAVAEARGIVRLADEPEGEVLGRLGWVSPETESLRHWALSDVLGMRERLEGKDGWPTWGALLDEAREQLSGDHPRQRMELQEALGAPAEAGPCDWPELIERVRLQHEAAVALVAKAESDLAEALGEFGPSASAPDMESLLMCVRGVVSRLQLAKRGGLE